MKCNTIYWQRYRSKAGKLRIGSVNGKLCLCDWEENPHAERNINRLHHLLNADFSEAATPEILRTINQIEEYFNGERRCFDLPLQLAGTPFQLSVWKELQKIPYATTVTYLDVARNIGRESAIRAVSQAIGANPISIIIPCHRVIGSNGKLTGYAGGMVAKRILLENERKSVIPIK